MKIGIMGTHGTGKSGFALQLAADLKKKHPGIQVGIVSEIARNCPFAINKDTSVEAQLWIYNAQMIAELEASLKNDIIVCDRTILDGLAYTKEAGFKEIFKEYFYNALNWLGTYDEIYWCRPKAAIADDGFRDTDQAFQSRIDLIIESWVKNYKIPVEIV